MPVFDKLLGKYLAHTHPELVVTKTVGGGGGGNSGSSSLAISDEGIQLTSTASSINFVGAGVTATDVGGAITVTIPGATASTPGGSDTQVQFNDGGSFGGDAGLVFNKTTNVLTAGEVIISGLTASRAVATDGSKQLVSATTTAAELDFVSGVTSAIQTQLNNKQPLDATLTALAAYNTNGLLTQTAADTFTGRTITGTTDVITVSNGSGVAGNPTITIAATYVGQTSITTLGTITTGAWDGTDIPLTAGGTGASTAADARTNLGLVAGGAGDIWVEKAGDTMTGALAITLAGTGLAVTQDSTIGGYLRVGSASAPTNTTAGDLTAVRLKVVDGAFGTGVDFSVTGDGALSGFLRVGSETAPTNTTAGDLTCVRFNIGNNAAFGATSGRFLQGVGTITATSGTEYVWFVQPSVTPASNSTAEVRTLGFDAIWNPSTGITQSTLIGGYFQWRIRGDALVATVTGVQATGMVVDSSSAATVQATTLQAYRAGHYSRPSGSTTATVATSVGYDTTGVTTNGLTVTDLIGLRVQNGANPTVTNQYGVQIASLTKHTTDLWGVQVAFPGIGNSQAGTTNLVGIGLPTASIVLGNTTGTTTMVAGMYIGIPTYTSTTNTRTVTNMAGLYIAGAPVASTNVTVTAGGGPYSIWVDAGTSAFGGNLVPDVSDVAALGTTALMFSDLFLASGGVINFNAGDVTITHSANTLTVAGGTLTTEAIAASGNLTFANNKGVIGTSVAASTQGILRVDTNDDTKIGSFAGNNIIIETDSSVYILGGQFVIASANAATNYFIVNTSGDTLAAGYLRAGSTSAPTNTTDGDLTAIRLFLGTNQTDFTVSNAGKVTAYNNIATVSGGVPSELATIDSTGLTANVGASTLYAVPASGAGLYRVSAYLVTTTAASVSSTMPNAQVVYTDSDSNTSVTLDVSPVLGAAGLGQSGTLAANTVGTVFSGVVVIYVKASTTIQYQTVNYASTIAGMTYALRIKLEAL